MAKKDYYEVLGVSRNAAPDEIRKAHRKLVRQHHPDVNKDNPASEEKFKEVQEAYDVLSDEQKRRNYDQFGHAGVGAESGRGGPPPGSDPFGGAFRGARRGTGRAYTWRSSPGVDVEDLGGEQFADLFEQFFGAQRASPSGRSATRGRVRPEPQRGADVEYPATLTFEQAARGHTLPLQLDRGGQIETIDVKIPPGVKDGSRVRIKGRGQASGGEPGDLYIITRVLPHKFFRRENLDVYLDVPLSLYEAMLGAKVSVPTLDGPRTITIPPGASGGTKLRIKGHGVERGDEKGDQYVVLRVAVPKNLDEEDRQTVQKLAAKHPINPRTDVGW